MEQQLRAGLFLWGVWAQFPVPILDNSQPPSSGPGDLMPSSGPTSTSMHEVQGYTQMQTQAHKQK